MKTLISFIFLSLILASCGSKGKSEARINVSSVTAAGVTMPGGLMLYGYNYDTQMHRAFKFFQNQDSFELANGKWDFFVLGWDGASKLEGNTYCGFTTQNLTGVDVVVNLTISQTNCTSPGTTGNKFLDAAIDFNNIIFESCSILPNGGAPIFSDNCTANAGKISSVQIGLVAVNGMNISACKNVSPGTVIPDIKIPFGYGTFEGFRTQVRAYPQGNCVGPNVDITLPKGLAHVSSPIVNDSAVELAMDTDGTDIKLFVKDNFPKIFTSTWTLGTSDTVTLPIVPGYSYDFFVNWGDGSPITHVTSYSDTDKAHLYATGGTYTVKIFGNLLEAWNFNTQNVGNSKDYIETVSSLGDLGWKNLSGAFYNCPNLISFTAGSETSLVTDMSFMFYQTTGITTLDLAGLDTSNVTNMNSMFLQSNASSVDTSAWNVSNVTNFRQMFRQTTINPNVSSWDTSSATNMQAMFAFNSSADPDVLSWDTSNVTNMRQLFHQASSASSIDVSGWNTSNVTDMSYMFMQTPSVLLDFTNWDTSNVTDFTSMFNLSNATFDASLLEVDSATELASMFESSTLGSVDLTMWNTSNVVNMTALFKGATSADPGVSGWNTSSLGLATEMFASAPSANPDFSGWNFAGVVDLNNIFNGATGITSANYTTLLVELYNDIGDPTSMAGQIIDVGTTQFVNSTAATAKTAISGVGKLSITDGGGI